MNGADEFMKQLAAAHSQWGKVRMRGFLPLYVLQLLKQRPYYGSEIIGELGKLTDGHWFPSPGTLYPLLRHLEKQNLVSGKWDLSADRPRRVYDLTPRGLDELERLREVVRPQLELAQKVLQRHKEFLFAEAH